VKKKEIQKRYDETHSQSWRGAQDVDSSWEYTAWAVANSWQWVLVGDRRDANNSAPQIKACLEIVHRASAWETEAQMVEKQAIRCVLWVTIRNGEGGKRTESPSVRPRGELSADLVRGGSRTQLPKRCSFIILYFRLWKSPKEQFYIHCSRPLWSLKVIFRPFAKYEVIWRWLSLWNSSRFPGNMSKTHSAI
jgi:hypothetical protein